MKQKLLLLIILILYSNILLLSNNNKLKITKLQNDFYVYTTFRDLNGYLFPSNGMFVITDNNAILIDTPWDTTQFQPLLDSIYQRHNKRVTLCISTHFHDDRTAGLEYYKSLGINTFSSKSTLDLCKKNNEKKAEYFFVNDTSFQIDNVSFETFYPGKGHSEDNIIVWFPKQKILYGGCFVKSSDNNNLGNIKDANIIEWKKSITKVKEKYKPKKIITGHFSWANTNSLNHTLELLNKELKYLKTKPNFRILGYFKGNLKEVEKYDYSKMTHVVFCFTYLKGDQVVLKNQQDEEVLKLLVKQKKKYPKLKVMFALGGWGGCESCSDVFNDIKSRKEFVNSVVAFSKKYNLDGFDLDWESPVIGGFKNHKARLEDKDNLTDLMKKLRESLPPPYELSFDANTFPEFVYRSVDWENIIQYVDFINLMTYGLPNDKPKHTGHHTSLYSSKFQSESIHKGILLLDSLKVPRNKLLIGAGFYGFIVNEVDTINNGLGQVGKSNGTLTYKEINDKIYKDENYKRYWDSTANAPFIYNKIKNIFITYDDVESCKLKTKYALDLGLGGIMYWKLNGDIEKNGLIGEIFKTYKSYKK